jgi:hypothetical protein
MLRHPRTPVRFDWEGCLPDDGDDWRTAPGAESASPPLPTTAALGPALLGALYVLTAITFLALGA